MIRLLQIEWLKLRHYRPFWILISMYAVLSTVFCSGIMLFMVYLKNQGADFRGFDPTMLPFYDFPDIWRNIAYLASFIKIILAFIVVMSVYNEINHRILRQNIIDGLSKKEWLATKLLFIGAIAAGVSVMLFINGLLLGLIYAHPDSYRSILQDASFLGIYFLDVFTYLTFAMMLTLVVRKGGLVIVGLLMYTLMLEPFASLLLYNVPEFPEYVRPIPDFFPVQSLRNLMPCPFKRYVLYEIPESVPLRDLAIVFAWLIFNIGVSFWLLRKRDV